MTIGGVEQVTRRIETIRSLPAGHGAPQSFQALLDAQVAAAVPVGGDAASATPATRSGPLAAQASGWGGGTGLTGSATLGAMLSMMGGPGPPTTRVVGNGFPSAPGGGGTIRTAELDTYLAMHGIEERNGRLSPHELVSVSGGWNGSAARLLAPAASSWESMRSAAAASGFDLYAIDTYRSWETQNGAYQAFLRGEKPANVLPPGKSVHGLGLAVDFTTGSLLSLSDPEWQWLTANAHQFGWYPISNESWHWEFRGTP